MSARRPIARAELPFLMMPTTPVTPSPRTMGMPHSVRRGGHHVGGALFFIAQFGMGMQVAPDLLQLRLERDNGFD